MDQALYTRAAPGYDPGLGLRAPRTAKATQNSEERQLSWTKVHSHFAITGGFAFDVSSVSKKLSRNRQPRKVLGTKALKILAHYDPGVLPVPTEDEVVDRSKVNAFAKMLVCLQATWFYAQVIGRLATSNPISILELNVCLHTLCCIAIYTAWWNKPLDVDFPNLLDTTQEWIAGYAAWLCFKNNPGAMRLSIHGPDLITTRIGGIRLTHDKGNLGVPDREQGRPYSTSTVIRGTRVHKLFAHQEVHGFQLRIWLRDKREWAKSSADRIEEVYITPDDMDLRCLSNLNDFIIANPTLAR